MRIEDENFWRAVEEWQQDNIGYIPQDLMRQALERGRQARSRAFRQAVRAALNSLVGAVRACTGRGGPKGSKTPLPVELPDQVPADGQVVPFSAEQIRTLRNSWALVEPIADAAMALFYGKLFDIDPSTRSMFARASMPGQRAKLAQALGLVIDGLDDTDGLKAMLRLLGYKHAGYGVTRGHYDSVGRALLATLEEGLGDAWTPRENAAWTAAYGVVRDTMLEGANEAYGHQPRQAA